MKLDTFAFYIKHGCMPNDVLTSFIEFGGRRTLIGMTFRKDSQQVVEMLWDLGIAAMPKVNNETTNTRD